MVTCEECNGACCRGLLIPIFETREELQLARKRGGVRVQPGLFAFPCPCPDLDNTRGKCRNYENRPRACAAYKPGCQDCLFMRRAFGEAIKKENSVFEECSPASVEENDSVVRE